MQVLRPGALPGGGGRELEGEGYRVGVGEVLRLGAG